MKDSDRVNLDRIVFIGRTYDEYVRMFDLDESFMRGRKVLDCPAGPSSFSAEAHVRGIDATACDVLYHLPAELLEEKGKTDVSHVYSKVDGVPHLYRWKYYKSRAEVFALRQRALRTFIDDYSCGSNRGRYVRAELPRLPFADKSFALVLSSHFLFLYGDRLDLDFHLSSVRELLRVCSGEVRIYPLQGLDAKPSPCLDEVLLDVRQRADAGIVEVPFEFQRGSNRMLRIRR